ncbi:MAG: bifunctional chorismate mutase/prephenate dehydratase [Deltaproteobacteria bacterium]|nr:bifunctional chorismate mutase/prephenate dehydratase [Deltaproteobacteria bacterium]
MKKGNGNDSGPKILDEYREKIDRADEQIISLLTRRQELALEIGRLKRETGMKFLDHAREQKLLRSLASKGNRNLSSQAIRSIFSEIISAARSSQQLPVVAYLGPEATFSHQAAISIFGSSASFRSAESIEEVFDLAEKDVCHQGVVPIENSYEGSVNITFDLFYKYDLKICAEVFVRIRHHLLSKAERIGDIRHLYSQHMTVPQCRSWMMAADEADAAAVGSRFCSQTYGLNILEEDIEDNPDNVTRFLVINKNGSEPTGKDKTSLLFFLQHQPGALHRTLEALADRGVNMARIESRPMKLRNWEYLFFVDIEGHEKDSNVGEALKEMEAQCVFMKRLGSYPAGGDPWD